MLLIHYDAQLLPAQPWGQDRPKSRLALWSREARRSRSGPADCTRGPEHPVGTAALGALLPPHPHPAWPQGEVRATAAGSREPQGAESPRCFGQVSAGSSLTGASPASSLLPPPSATAFFSPRLSTRHFSRNLTYLTSHREKVLSFRKTTKSAIQIFLCRQAAGFPTAAHVPGETRGREKMNALSAEPFYMSILFPYCLNYLAK